jgi:hypothetical protein
VRGFGRRLFLDVEQLPVDAVAGHAEAGQDADRVFDHAERAAQPPVIHRRHLDRDRQQRAQLGGVEPAVEQLDLLRLAAEQVDQADPRRVGVLEVGDLVGEHHRVVAPVAVEQRHGEPSCAASTDPAMDKMGVIPLPAAIRTWWPGFPDRG